MDMTLPSGPCKRPLSHPEEEDSPVVGCLLLRRWMRQNLAERLAAAQLPQRGAASRRRPTRFDWPCLQGRELGKFL